MHVSKGYLIEFHYVVLTYPGMVNAVIFHYRQRHVETYSCGTLEIYSSFRMNVFQGNSITQWNSSCRRKPVEEKCGLKR